MSYERRKRRRVIKSSFRIAIIAFIFIYLAFRSIPILLANTAKTILPIEEVVIDIISSQGIVIKDEVVYKAEGNGQLDSKIKEGERVSAGIEIANINLLADTSQLKLELIEIENAIAALSITDKDNGLLKNEKTKISEKQDKLIESIQIAINLGQYQLVNVSKTELSLYDSKANDIASENKLLGQSIEKLKEKREKLLEEVSSNNIKYYTTNSGIVSYVIDGYESIYLPKDFENYTFESLNLEPIKVDNVVEKDVEIGSAVFKMIDNFQWYLALKIENIKDILEYEVNDTITLQIENDDKELEATIIAINTSNSKAVIILRLNNYLHEYYNLRFPKVDIIKSKKQALKIPTKVIIEKGSQKGVYIKEINGIVKFRPINIISEVGDYTYIDRGDDRGYINVIGQEKALKTVSLYDEIFSRTNSIKEGQILN